MKLPKEFEDKMIGLIGKEEFSIYEEKLEEDNFHGLRVNTSKISVEDFLKISPFSLTPVPWTKNGFYYDKEEKPAKHPYYFAGLYYIQEPSAMTPASLMPVEPGDKVLDICAAPGGKSTELAAKLNGTGLLVSNDISNSRAKALLKNLEMFGIANSIIVSEPPNKLAERFHGYFDKILIDAPCSGEGMFRKSNSMITAWEKNGVDLFVGLQRSILKEVVTMLKPGGMILYSTCTFSPEENEQAIEYLLELNPDMEIIELPKEWGFADGNPDWGLEQRESLRNTIRIWPHKVQGEGHFVALLKDKREDRKDSFPTYHYKKEKLPDFVKDFLNQLDAPYKDGKFEIIKDNLYWLPEGMADIKGLRLLRSGLYLGVIKKNRFEPSQSLAMALKASQFPNSISLSVKDPRVMKYLKGETIEDISGGKDGYVLFCVDGYPLGWGKLSGTTLKNKYHTGWRWM
ncbi:MAG: RsmB/NOP family class I SAM-dependent RNA methyltransferase [Lachnospiraceae bacterium]|nr:RsmB/NOP family class I SAM-dependent RNA methyltransferase [Lachnospiraceae bacterium]